MACILKVPNTMGKKDGTFKADIQKVLDKVVKGRKRVVLVDDYYSYMQVYYTPGVNEVYLLRVKDRGRQLYFSVSVNKVTTEKELKALIIRNEDMLLVEDKTELKKVIYDLIIDLRKNGVVLV